MSGRATHPAELTLATTQQEETHMERSAHPTRETGTAEEPTVTDFPTRKLMTEEEAYLNHGSPYGRSVVGWREGRRLCEATVSRDRVSIGRDDEGIYGVDEMLCDNHADIIWVGMSGGHVQCLCAGHIPDPKDEGLKPVLDCQTGRWRSCEFQIHHELTGFTPVPLQDCPPEAMERATAVAARLKEYESIDLEPAGWGPGWMGDEEDRKRLEAAGEKTSFPHIPESMQDNFDGAKTMFDVVARMDAVAEAERTVRGEE